MTVWAAEQVLVGRDADARLLRSFLEQAATGGAALLLTGEPGVGKSALLHATADEAEARGFTVLAAAGVEFEAEVGFAALNQLLLPVLDGLTTLVPLHRAALSEALGFSAHPAAGRLVVSTAALALLRQVAATRPVLVLVDDLPWLDRASARVLGFVARRLTGARIGFLGAARSGTAGFFDQARLPGHVVGPLTATTASDLVRRRFPSLTPDVRRRIVAEARGNPLALLELPRPGPTPSTDRPPAQRRPADPEAAENARPVHVDGDATAAARRVQPDPPVSLCAAVATAYHLLNGNGDVDTAHRLLVSALETTPRSHDDGAALSEALHTLLLVCFFSGRDSPWRPFEAAVGRSNSHVPTTLALSATTFADPARTTAATLHLLDTALALADDGADPTEPVRLGIAAFYVDRLAGVRAALGRVARDGRGDGDVASRVSALMMLCHDALETGRWDEAQRWAEEGVGLADSHGYRLIAWPGWYCLAVLAAVTGDDRSARQRADEMAAWAAPRGARTVELYAVHARLLAASARGDFEEAYRQATTVGPAGEFPRHAPIALRVALDLVEAAVHTGRRDEALAHVGALQRLELTRLSPRLALVAAGAAGMADVGGSGGACFEQALSVPGGERYPFEHARVRLAYGEHLRRTREPGAARLQLTAALETFRRLGAQPWAVRAAKELRATGGTRVPAGTRDLAALTPQEEQIALLAASGLTNKEIAARLYVSPRTVSAHLYRVFPKLGVTARAALRDALTARSAGGFCS